ncbi:small GTP-binding protein, putative [Trichomonas vaginalis G3]|uniref:Small GTP-binding protein, putative n=1 Tax=Trichomonas vaginalis (strain ATCC PRA-98 / G3) TaxID=412133 RepID=A2DWP5_TRIV3|nr:GTPase protein [Trichomonas vaginalis G3]EAY15230.1 small GTP-binding protein, putative [Trichomonas vaginalis G3]KAI5550616.1 GTPase protein [Trichomonas vaginalis G3]|eukprot:XP_001327453.1 small GTP-binding protein [Trichomonas vaginalis G3]
MNETFEAKLVTVGATNTGKTCLLIKLATDSFEENTKQSVGGSFLNYHFTKDSTNFTLKLWDTAGQERYRSVNTMYYVNAQVFCLVFSLTDPYSFDDIPNLYNEVKEYAESSIIYLIGCKADLSEDRRVKSELAYELSKTINALYFEVSSKTGQGFYEFKDQLNFDINQKYQAIKKENEDDIKPIRLTDSEKGENSCNC